MNFEELQRAANIKITKIAQMVETPEQSELRLAAEELDRTARRIEAARQFAKLLADMTAIDNRTAALIELIYPDIAEDTQKPSTSALTLCEAPANDLGFTVIRARVEQHPWNGPIQPNYNSIDYLLEGESQSPGALFLSCATPFREFIHNRHPGDPDKLLEFDWQLSALEALA